MEHTELPQEAWASGAANNNAAQIK